MLLINWTRLITLTGLGGGGAVSGVNAKMVKVKVGLLLKGWPVDGARSVRTIRANPESKLCNQCVLTCSV